MHLSLITQKPNGLGVFVHPISYVNNNSYYVFGDKGWQQKIWNFFKWTQYFAANDCAMKFGA